MPIFHSKQNKKIKKDSLTIDVTPIELPHEASNYNNSKTSIPTPENAEVKPTEEEKIKKLDNGYKTSETESALDEYLTPDLTPEASTKSEDSIISNKAPDTEHKVTLEEIRRCLNLYKG